MERRSRERCEVCQGPTKYVEGRLVCRNSLCSFNFREVVCPRCNNKGADCADFKGGEYMLSCPECLHQWKSIL